MSYSITPRGGLRPRHRRGRGLSSQRLSAVAWPTATILGILAVWEAWVRIADTPLYLMPTASAVLEASVTHFDRLSGDVLTTAAEIAIGFAVSVGIGIPLAFLLDAWPPLERASYPFLVASQVLPVVALAPVLITWFGFGLLPKIVIIFLFSIFVIVVHVLIGLRSLRIEKLYLVRSMGASPLSVVLRLKIPNALPHIFVGLKLAVTLAVVGAVVGEFVASQRGLGHVILTATSNFDTVTLFVAIVYLVIIGVAAFALMELCEKLTIGWHVSRRTAGGRTGG